MRNKPKLSDDLLQQVNAIGPQNKKQVQEEVQQSRTLPMPLRSDDLDRIEEPSDVKRGK